MNQSVANLRIKFIYRCRLARAAQSTEASACKLCDARDFKEGVAGADWQALCATFCPQLPTKAAMVSEIQYKACCLSAASIQDSVVDRDVAPRSIGNLLLRLTMTCRNCQQMLCDTTLSIFYDIAHGRHLCMQVALSIATSCLDLLAHETIANKKQYSCCCCCHVATSAWPAKDGSDDHVRPK